MRKAIACLIVLIYLTLWIILASIVGSKTTDWPMMGQIVFYIIAGIGWIFPLRPLFRWMNANEGE